MSNNTLAVSDDINQILPFYQKLATGDVADVIPKMQALAHAGNMYANYVLGIYLIFGRVPRHYNFNKSYPESYVQQNSLLKLNEQLGLSHLIQLIRLKDNVEQYQMKGLYDLYKIIDGSSEFFKNNDIQCRPTENSFTQLKKLFDSKGHIRDILVRLDHYEIYLDYAKHKLANFDETQNEEEFKQALSYLNKIVEKSEFNQFNVHDISEAHYQLGKIYLFGNAFCKRDAKAGIGHIEAARLDKGFVTLLEFYKAFGDQYIKSIRKCIGMIVDNDLRKKLLIENGFVAPDKVDTSEILRKLQAAPVIQNTKPAITIDEIEDEEIDEEAALEAKLTEDEVLRNTQSIAEEFDSSLLDDTEEPLFVSSTDDADEALMGEGGDDDHLDFMEQDEFEVPDELNDDFFEPDF